MWTQLLWKDTRQVLPGVAIFLALTVVGQLLSIWNAESFEQGLRFIIGIAALCPFVVVLFCLGALFGAERQSRTMHWQSTLPILWYRSFISKWIVTTVMTAVAFLIVFLIVERNAGGSFNTHYVGVTLEYGTVSFVWTVSTWIVAAALFTTIFMLLVDEPLYAIAIAAIVMAVTVPFYLICKTIPDALSPLLKLTMMVTWVAGPWILVVTTVALYRWRWYRGFHASAIQLPNGLFNLLPKINRLPFRMDRQWWPQLASVSLGSFSNHSFLSLLAQSCRQAILFRIVVVMAPWVWVATMPWGTTNRPPSRGLADALLFSVTWSFLLLGLSCFTHDHSKNRIRFLSDRGISAWQFYLARTIPTFFAALCSLASVAVVKIHHDHVTNTSYTNQLLYAVSSLCIYFVGQLVGLCFRNVVLSLAAAIAIFCGYTIIGSMIAFGDSLIWNTPFAVSYQDFVGSIVIQVLCAWMLSAILISIVWTIPQWLRWEQTRFGLGTGFVLAGIVVPVLLIGVFTTNAYLRIPKQKWIPDTLSIGDFQESERSTPQKVSFTEPLAIGNLQNWSDYQQYTYKIIKSRTNNEAWDAIKWLDSLQQEMSTRSRELDKVSAKPNQLDWRSQTMLNRWSKRISILARIAIISRHRKLFDQAITTLVKLTEFNNVVDPVSHMLQQIHLIRKFESCNDNDLRWMLESQSLKPLLQDVLSLDEYRRWSIMRSITFKESLTNPDDTVEGMRKIERYALGSDFVLEIPIMSVHYQPYALSTCFIRSRISREFAAEIEAAEGLIAMKRQASKSYESLPIYDAMQDYEKARRRYELPAERIDVFVDLSDFLHYRESLNALNDRIQEIGKQQQDH